MRIKTKRSTDYRTNVFQQWAKTRGKNEQLESYEVPELNEALDANFGENREEIEEKGPGYPRGVGSLLLMTHSYPRILR